MLVESLVGGSCEVGFAFCPGEFRRIFVGFFDEFFYLGARGVVVKELVVAFFDAFERGGGGVNLGWGIDDGKGGE